MTRSAAAIAHDEQFVVASDVLGPLTVGPAELLQFPQGLYGFPDCHGWVLVPTKRDGLFWLQSTQHARRALLVDLFMISLLRGRSQPQTLPASAPVSRARYRAAVVNRSRDGALPTANLQGPVVFNMCTRQGFQIVLRSRATAPASRSRSTDASQTAAALPVRRADQIFDARVASASIRRSTRSGAGNRTANREP